MATPREEATQYPGIYRRTYPGRKPVYVRRWRDGGRGSAKRSRTFDSLADARRFNPDNEPEPEPEPEASTSSTTPLAEFGELWRGTLGTRKTKTKENYESAYRVHVEPRFGHRPVGAVTHTSVMAFLSDLADDGYSEATRRNVYTIVRMVLNVAVDERAIPSNPLAGRNKQLAKPRPKKGERPTLDAKQLARLANEVGPAYSLFVETLGWSGMRLGEACALRVCDVDPLHNGLQVCRAQSEPHGYIEEGWPKDKEARFVELPPSLMRRIVRHIEANNRRPQDTVFTTVQNNRIRASKFTPHVLQKAVARLVEHGERKGGFGEHLAGLVSHDLRHTYVRIASEAGVHPFEIQRQLGHSSSDMTYRYSHRGRVGAVSAALESHRDVA